MIKRNRANACLLLLAVLAGSSNPELALQAAEPAPSGSPFNGKDLTGWKTRADPAFPGSQWVVGAATANARFLKVVLNGKTIHDNVELPRPTGGEQAKSPLLLQGTHGRVAFRNIRIVSKTPSGEKNEQ